jgi:hypothetical protein
MTTTEILSEPAAAAMKKFFDTVRERKAWLDDQPKDRLFHGGQDLARGILEQEEKVTLWILQAAKNEVRYTYDEMTTLVFHCLAGWVDFDSESPPAFFHPVVSALKLAIKEVGESL